MIKQLLTAVILLTTLHVFSQSKKPFFQSTSSQMVVRPALSSQIPLPPPTETQKKRKGEANKRWINYPTNFNALPKGKDALIQTKQGSIQARETSVNFESAREEDPYSAWSVPDPTGAVGPNHYIIAYNTGFAIYDKSGNILVPHASLATLWPGEEEGDPVVLYDRYIDRFVITQFTGFTSGNNGFLFAVCQGSDPVNDGWYTYRFNTEYFPDYPKYSVWRDAYYITANKSFGNVVYAVERDKMSVGDDTAQIVGFNLPGVVENSDTIFAPLPMNSAGPNLPDEGTPGYIVYLQDDAWAGIDTDHLKIWEVNLDWDNTGNSTISPPTEIPTTPFDSFVASFGAGEVPQPGTGQKIDGITGVVSFMCNYWNYGSYNASTVNFNVDVNGDNGILGIRWFELRNSGAGWNIHQEGTYAPDDGLYRFLGSMCMDINGNIGMGFNVGSETVYPSIRYTGRYANDPLGEMTIAEENIVSGEGVRDFLNRFGDYAQLTIDPTDNKTFWHAAEYVKANGKWSIRTAAFRIAPNFQNDMGVTSIDAPESGTLTDHENITVTVFNYGETEQSNVDVFYQIDGGEMITETFTGSVASASSAQYTFSTPADMSVEGHDYTVVAGTLLNTDEDNTNNTFTKTITFIGGNDVGVSEITAPVSGNSMGSENIVVKVTNYGLNDQSNFDISYQIQNNTPVVETFTDVLAGGETATYTFTTPGDFSNPQGYNLKVKTSLNNDINTENDALSTVVFNAVCHSKGINTNMSIGPDIQTRTSQLNFPFEYIISDVDVSINIDHNRDSDLDIYLISPDGTRVELTTDNGGTGHNYTDTVFDDQAEIAITSGTAPFTNTYKPEGNLSDFNGKNCQGVWKLEINDDEDGQGGTLHSWNINVCGYTSAGIYENEIDAGDLVLENYGNNHFILRLPGEAYEGLLQVEVFNIYGQKVLSKPVGKIDNAYTFPLNMESKASGVYIIRLGNTVFGKTKRIIVK